MPEMTSYPHGMFNWSDLGTTDQSAAKKFYTSLLELKVNDMPMGLNSFYSMLQKDGKDVAALYEQQPAQREQGIAPNWLAYFSVKSADETAKKIKSLGGKLLSEPFDVFDAGRMAIAQDPQGAVFAIWQPKRHLGAGVMSDPGTLCWNELMTTDPDGARKFYTPLFGMKAEAFHGGGNYTVFKIGDQMAGGMMQLRPEMKGVPPHWLIYFAVADCDATVRKAQQLGGAVLNGPTDIPNVGRFAVLGDPQGAAFAVIKLAAT